MKKYALLSLAAMIAAPTYAAIIDLGTITRDSDTGLDWLDVTETQGLSYNQVVAEMGVGGAYEGWRYATAAEFDQLILNFGYQPVQSSCIYGTQICDAVSVNPNSELIETIIKTLGDTTDAALDAAAHTYDAAPDGAGQMQGLLDSSLLAGGTLNRDYARIADNEYIVRATGLPYSDANDLASTLAGARANSLAHIEIGSLLVQASPVPIPAGAWLFGSALLGLAGMRVRH